MLFIPQLSFFELVSKLYGATVTAWRPFAD